MILLEINNRFLTNIERIAAIVVLFVVKGKANDVLTKHLNANYCIKDEPICGTDGITYENECQLTESRYKKRDGLVAASRGPCKSGKSSNMNYTIFLINYFQIIPFLTNKLIFMNIKVFFSFNIDFFNSIKFRELFLHLRTYVTKLVVMLPFRVKSKDGPFL